MSAYPRCAALLRSGQPCGRTVAKGSEFCVHHEKLLETVDAEAMRQGRTPKKRARERPALRVVSESSLELVRPDEAALTGIDPARVRPLLAAAAAENVEQLTASLLEAAGSAVKPVWVTVECSGCGERSRVEAPVPDVRARIAAIELLLREGLGRAPQAEEAPILRLPDTAAEIEKMGWRRCKRSSPRLTWTRSRPFGDVAGKWWCARSSPGSPLTSDVSCGRALDELEFA
jgi:hypothetical protein